jgi:lysophospholipase L1-like esterase
MKVTLLTTIVCFYVSALASETGVTKIEAFGDSLSAGFLSNTKVVEAPPLPELSRIVSDLAAYKLFHNLNYLKPHQNAAWAWPQRLSELLASGGGKIEVLNYAVSGAFTKDLSQEVKEAPSAEESWSFFFIGHNDLCRNAAPPETVAKKFKESYQKALTEWDAKHKNAVGFIVPVGDIHRVYAALEGYVWHQSKGAKLSCWDSWSLYFPYCPSYAKLQRTHQLEGFLAPRIQAMNSALSDMVNEWNHKSLQNRFLFLDGVHDRDYEPRLFAVDCFHLSSQGQEALATSVYETLQHVM